jgi:HTH-type transcriptional regulator / antitoxin HigA
MASTHEREDFSPNWAVHPGEILEERLEVFGLTQAEFARRSGLTTKLVSEIISGKNPVSPVTARAIAPVVGLQPIVWLNLQSEWSLFEARRNAALPASAESLFKRLPIAELKKRNILPDRAVGADLLDHVLKFLGVGTVAAYEGRCHGLAVNYRHSAKLESSPDHVFAWLQCGEIRARRLELGSYDKEQFSAIVKGQLRMLTLEKPEQFWPQMEALCREAGVALVCEKPFSGTKLSGAARWLDEGNPIIQLSLRHKTNDHFWWTFFHECGHVLLHPDKNFVDDENAVDGVRAEAQADAFALEVLVGQDRLSAFAATRPKSEAAIMDFANRVGIHPGLIVGMLQFRKVVPWTHLNRLKERFEWID